MATNEEVDLRSRDHLRNCCSAGSSKFTVPHISTSVVILFPKKRKKKNARVIPQNVMTDIIITISIPVNFKDVNENKKTTSTVFDLKLF